MAEPTTVVITGAPAASAWPPRPTSTSGAGGWWPPCAHPRSAWTGCGRPPARADDPRLVAVRLDLADPEAISGAAGAILDVVGAPHGLVHNAGMAAVGAVEELPDDVLHLMFATNVVGPMLLTKSLLPAMRTASRGRIVAVSSEGGIRGMPAIGAYSATKGSLERWAESLSQEIAPFGLGVTVLVAGTFKTDILELTPTYADADGPYAGLHVALGRMEAPVQRFAASPDRFAPAVARALADTAPFVRRAVGLDARAMLPASRILPTRLFQRVVGVALGLPSPGALEDDDARLRRVHPRDDGQEHAPAARAEQGERPSHG
ncbi:MAG: SDR family NAD(P)-dependent oxidoreductase [Acidimicrobiales bacterium]